MCVFVCMFVRVFVRDRERVCVPSEWSILCVT